MLFFDVPATQAKWFSETELNMAKRLRTEKAHVPYSRSLEKRVKIWDHSGSVVDQETLSSDAAEPHQSSEFLACNRKRLQEDGRNVCKRLHSANGGACLNEPMAQVALIPYQTLPSISRPLTDWTPVRDLALIPYSGGSCASRMLPLSKCTIEQLDSDDDPIDQEDSMEIDQ